jgi:hypothetical protein
MRPWSLPLLKTLHHTFHRLGQGGAGTMNPNLAAHMAQAQPGQGFAISSHARPARPTVPVAVLNTSPNSVIRIRLMKDLDSPVIGKVDFVREFGPFKAGRDVEGPRYVGESLHEKGYAIIY